MPVTDKRSGAATARRKHPLIENAEAPTPGDAGKKKKTATGRAEQWFRVRDAFLKRPAARQIEQIREGLEASTLVGAAEALGVPQETIFTLVGLASTTAKRKVAKAETLDAPTTERLARIGAIEKLAEETFGDTELGSRWLRTRNVGLGNVTPLSMLDTDIGCREVSRILNAIAYGGVA